MKGYFLSAAALCATSIASWSHAMGTGPRVPVHVKAVVTSKSVMAPEIILSVLDGRVSRVDVESTLFQKGRQVGDKRATRLSVAPQPQNNLLPQDNTSSSLLAAPKELTAKLEKPIRMDDGVYAEQVQLKVRMTDRKLPYEIQQFRHFEMKKGEIVPLTPEAYSQRVDPSFKITLGDKTIVATKGGSGPGAILSTKEFEAQQDEAPRVIGNITDNDRSEEKEP